MFTEYDTGQMNVILQMLGMEPIKWLKEYPTSYFALLLLCCWRWTGVNMLYFLSGLKGIDEGLYESADIDGATAWQKFRYVTIPLLKPTTIYVLTISVYAGLAMFLESFMLWGVMVHRVISVLQSLVTYTVVVLKRCSLAMLPQLVLYY